MIWLLTSLALADPCPDPAEQLQSANLAFEDAEVAQAQAHIDQAVAGLLCIEQPVDNDTLQELYGFAAVVAYASGDEVKARDAMRQLHTTSLSANPHAYFGPELTEMFDQVNASISQEPVELTIDSGWRRAWVDGELMSGGDRADVRVGRHLIQAPTGDGWFADRVSVNEDSVLGTDGQVAPVSMALAPEDPRPDPVERPKRRHRTGLLVAGALTAAAGGGALVYGWQSESTFKVNPYDDANYGGCAVADACYADARIDAIQGDASRIRVAYLAGYALTAVGVGVVGTELFILPAPRGATGGQLGIRGAF